MALWSFSCCSTGVMLSLFSLSIGLNGSVARVRLFVFLLSSTTIVVVQSVVAVGQRTHEIWCRYYVCAVACPGSGFVLGERFERALSVHALLELLQKISGEIGRTCQSYPCVPLWRVLYTQNMERVGSVMDGRLLLASTPIELVRERIEM